MCHIGVGMSATFAVTRTGIEHGVAGKQGGGVSAREKTDMAHGMARCIKRLEFNGPANLDQVAGP